MSSRGPIVVYELYQNGFLQTAEYFASGVDHPCFYDVVKECNSYRKVKRKLRSYQRYKEFAKTYTYPSGRVKFSRVRAACYFDYYQPEERDPEDYPEFGW